MKKLKALAIDDLVFLDEVIEKRRNGINWQFFDSKRAAFKDAWNSYLTDIADLKKFNPNDKQWQSKKNTIINLYENATEPVSNFKDKLKNHYFGGLECCSYCGLPNVNTIDHYLPSSIFPQFSFLTKNLVPSCYSCNRTKSNKLSGANGEYFFHPYFDQILSEQLLTFTTEIKFKSVVFNLHPVATLSSDIRVKVEYQIKELDLQQRLTSAAKTPWNGLVKSVKKNKWNRDKIIDSLETISEMALNQNDCANNISFIVYSAIASSAEAINYLEDVGRS